MSRHYITDEQIEQLADAMINFDSAKFSAVVAAVKKTTVYNTVDEALNSGDGVYRP